jgi:hypothetical protein
MIINAEFYEKKVKNVMNYIYNLLCVVRRFIFNIEKRKCWWYDTPVGLVVTRECWYSEITFFGSKHQIINKYIDYR